MTHFFRILFALLWIGSVPVARAQYSFTLVTDSNSATFSNFGVPAINASGTVGFYAGLDAGGTGIFTVAGGTVTSVALSSGPTFSAFDTIPSINNAGTVAFTATLDAGGRGSTPAREEQRPPLP
ncbi:MAG: choice-of-anchor tandem repeat NxxGxxAF-containing protein [Chthoniobacter sp.]